MIAPAGCAASPGRPTDGQVIAFRPAAGKDDLRWRTAQHASDGASCRFNRILGALTEGIQTTRIAKFL